MSTHELSRKQWVPAPLQTVFPFFAEAANLEALTPPLLRFTITRTPPRMEAGARIEYKLRVRGVPIRWRTIIEQWDPPHSFVDVQARGPYKLWHHTHRFWEEDGGTWLEDRVLYKLPFGPIGALVHSLIVRRDVETIFDFRKRVIEERFGTRTTQP